MTIAKSTCKCTECRLHARHAHNGDRLTSNPNEFDIGIVIAHQRNDKDGSVIVGGCGMDMGFNIVYSLSRRLWPKGFKLPKGKAGRNGDTSGTDTDGGYALNQRWL